MQKMDRFYTHYRVDLATGRLASYDRNIQNIPPDVREVFKPDSGIWTISDASQIEMRIWAEVTQDPVMLAAYANGENVHLITQEALWPGSVPKQEPIYTRSKTYNYSMIFDADDKVMSVNTGLSLKTTSEFKTRWLEKYKVGAAWMQWQKEQQVPYVETLFGRRMKLPPVEIFGEKHVNNCKLNYIPQGTAAEIIKRAMIIGDAMELPQVVQVHDEVLFDGEVEVPSIWTRIHPTIMTPFDSRVCKDWY